MLESRFIDQENEFLREAWCFLFQTPGESFWDFMKAKSFPSYDPANCFWRWPSLKPRDIRRLWRRAERRRKKILDKYPAPRPEELRGMFLGIPGGRK